MPSVRRALILVACGLATLGACGIADIPGGGVVPNETSEGGALQTCTNGALPERIEAVDLAALAVCECKAGGKAHCVPTAKMPDGLSKQLAACDNAAGGCVPDTIIATGGEPPPTCKSSGSEGRCLSLCVPKVQKYAEILTRGDGSTCAEDEKCIPCKMPDGSSSGICDIGKAVSCADAGPEVVPDAGPISCPYTGPELDISQLPICAPGGRCVSEAFVESVVTNEQTKSELKARLATCATGYCVPEPYLKAYGQYKPATCTSFAGIEGRCYSTVFKDVNAQKDLLHRDVCSENDRCIPCFNPADGAPSGACTTVSCDAPTTAPPVLVDCCTERGKCVPKKDIPSGFQSRLTPHECDAETELCVPTENVDLKSVPTVCTPATNPAGTVGNGVCVSKCLRFSFLESLILKQGICAAEHTCIPCNDPNSGAPTGAPGCN